MSCLVFLVEEQSMAMFLRIWIERAFPHLSFKCVPHEGKQDLLKSVPRKLKAWREPGTGFVVVIDNDRQNCTKLKAKIQSLCYAAGRKDVIVRIACQELEAWYLGDPVALAAAFDDHKLHSKLNKARFREPDTLSRPSEDLARLVPQFQKVGGARAVAKHIDIERNRSASFKVFAASINSIADQYLRSRNLNGL